MRVYSHIMTGAIMKQNSYNQDYKIHNELIQLRRRVEGFESGEIYQKFKNEYEKKLVLKDREINRLTKRTLSFHTGFMHDSTVKRGPAKNYDFTHERLPARRARTRPLTHPSVPYTDGMPEGSRASRVK